MHYYYGDEEVERITKYGRYRISVVFDDENFTLPDFEIYVRATNLVSSNYNEFVARREGGFDEGITFEVEKITNPDKIRELLGSRYDTLKNINYIFTYKFLKFGEPCSEQEVDSYKIYLRLTDEMKGGKVRLWLMTDSGVRELSKNLEIEITDGIASVVVICEDNRAVFLYITIAVVTVLVILTVSLVVVFVRRNRRKKDLNKMIKHIKDDV